MGVYVLLDEEDYVVLMLWLQGTMYDLYDFDFKLSVNQAQAGIQALYPTGPTGGAGEILETVLNLSGKRVGLELAEYLNGPYRF